MELTSVYLAARGSERTNFRSLRALQIKCPDLWGVYCNVSRVVKRSLAQHEEAGRFLVGGFGSLSPQVLHAIPEQSRARQSKVEKPARFLK